MSTSGCPMRREACAHTITDGQHRLVCRRKASHREDHTTWVPTGRIEWDTRGLVLAKAGSYYAYRNFRPGQRYEVVGPLP
jgi:hypothetical protein